MRVKIFYNIKLLAKVYICSLLSLWLLFPIKGFATIFNVTSTEQSGQGSLAQAIIDAKSDFTSTPTSPHIINFSINGRFTVPRSSSAANIDNHIYFQGNFRKTVFEYFSVNICCDATVYFKDIVVEEAEFIRTQSIDLGSGARVFIDNCIFDGKNSPSGPPESAIIVHTGSYVEITNSHLMNWEQSALVNWGGHMVIKYSAIIGNSYFSGGGIRSFESGILEINHSLIMNNTADVGAGVHAESGGGEVSIKYCTISNNKAVGFGAGIYIAGTMTIENCTFITNEAIEKGGGIFHQTGSSSSIVNSTFVDNKSADGYAIYNKGLFKVINCTIASNFRTSPGGDNHRGQLYNSNTGRLELTNNIIARGDIDLNNVGIISISRKNLIQTCSSGCPEIEYNSNPNLTDITDNGGFTWTMKPRIPSAVIDGGTSIDAPLIDQQGKDRDQSPDIGAYEYSSNTPIDLKINAFLQGPYNGVRMEDNLKTVLGGLPFVQPYPFNYENSTLENPLSSYYPPLMEINNGIDDIVDWVLVELRSNQDNVLTSKAALIDVSGKVVDADPSRSPLSFMVEPGDYYVVLKHRNHLGVMTKEPVTVSSN